MSDRGRGRGRGRGEQFSLPYVSRGGGATSGRGRGAPSDRGGPYAGRGDRGGGRGGPYAGRGDRGGGRGGFTGGGRPGPLIFSHGPNDSALPDKQVIALEDGLQKSFKAAGQISRSKDELPLPFRPGYGSRGKPITVWANYFEMLVKNDVSLYRYKVAFDNKNSQPTGIKLKRTIQVLLEDHFASAIGHIATDYKATLISSKKLVIPQQVLSVQYRGEREDRSQAPSDSRTYRTKVEFDGTLSLHDMLQYMQSPSVSHIYDGKGDCIQALNIIFGHFSKAHEGVANVGANKHYAIDNRAEKADLGGGLEALRGYFVSVRPAALRVLVNVQVKSAACYLPLPLEELMDVFRRAEGPNRPRLDRFLTRVRVRVTHLTKKNSRGEDVPRVKTIIGLARTDDGTSGQDKPRVYEYGAGAQGVEFFLKDDPKASAGSRGRWITVAEFFKKTYNITLKSPRAPVVNVGTKVKPVYLPPEVCHVMPGQPARSKLSSRQTQQMIKFACRKPADNARSIVNSGASVLGLHPNMNKTLQKFGVNVPPKLVAVNARILPSPSIKYRNGATADTRFGGWNMRNIKFSQGARLQKWTWLYIQRQHRPNAPPVPLYFPDQESFARAISSFTGTMRASGVMADNCQMQGERIAVVGGGNDNDEKLLAMKLDTLIKRHKPQLVLVVIDVQDDPLYAQLKHQADVKCGVATVCCLSANFVKNDPQTYANIALKVNLKMGGVNQMLEPSKLGFIAEGKTMVVGIDVTHPSPGSHKVAPSVAGIVASIDKHLAQWPAQLAIQSVARQEMVSGLGQLFQNRLRLWQKHNKVLPEQILVFRDGVSEGQYEKVLNEELPLMRKACAETYPADMTKRNLPRFTIAIVGKRHNTRFYPTSEANGDKKGNTQNGTVVDRMVTEPRQWEMYLQAHTAIQGTARPAHYVVIHDEIIAKWKETRPGFQNASDTFQDLAHCMSYLQGRATKAVSICPAAYYADLVCERARMYLRRVYDPSVSAPPSTVGGGADEGAVGGSMVTDITIHPNLKDSMFYI